VKHSPPAALSFLSARLRQLEDADLLRKPRASLHEGLCFCSNDYLGLASRLAPSVPLGAGASRLVSGDSLEHRHLERGLAEWLGTAKALVFTSGYAANVGVLGALATSDDTILSDALNHASIIDGARLSRAEIVVYPHLDVGAVRAALESRRHRRCWVVTESYFSMDADSPDVRALRVACDEAGAGLIVDEAHAMGVLGPDGRGVCAKEGVVPDVLVGTLGKAFGAAGAFVAGCGELIDWLWNRARSFVFSTGLSPAVARGALEGLRTSIANPELRERALARASELRSGLEQRGISALGYGVIVPCPLGEPSTALRIAGELQRHGIFVQAIRPPTVPSGTARLRMTACASHSRADIEKVLAAVDRAWPPKAP
jgi:8-amino-7-oxononanoate synthase